MNTKILLVLFGLSASLAQAQTQKGNGILSGGISLSYGQSTSRTYKQTSSSTSLNMKYGQFVADNWMAGVTLSIAGDFTKDDVDLVSSSAKQQQKAATLAPFFRRYWLVGPVVLFAGAGVQASLSDYRNTTVNSTGPATTRQNQFKVIPSVDAGGAYFLSKRIALEGSVSANSLPVPTSNINIGLVYWAGPTGTGKSNPDATQNTTQPGNWVLGGGFSIDRATQKTELANASQAQKSMGNSASVNVSVGRFVANNTLVGVGLNYSTLTQTQTPPGQKTTMQVYSIAPYVQRYLTKKRLTPFLRGTLLYSNSGMSSSDDRIHSLQGTVGLGLAYLINRRFIVETSLASVSYQVINFDQENHYNVASLTGQLGSNFSLRYVIPGRR